MSEPAEPTFTIEGAAIHDIDGFYAELNRLFMTTEDWTLGSSLDALDDLLYGGYGAFGSGGAARIVWRDHSHSREALGVEATRAYYLGKLARPDLFSHDVFAERLAALDAGTGATYFDLILEVFSDHSNITLDLA